MAITVETISKRTGLKYLEIYDLMKSRGISPREDGKYHSIDCEMLFDEHGKVRDIGTAVLRTMSTSQIQR